MWPDSTFSRENRRTDSLELIFKTQITFLDTFQKHQTKKRFDCIKLFELY